MTSDELLALFRADVVDDVAPYLWSDEECYAYMNDAYHMFARLTGGTPDATSGFTTLTASEDTATTVLDNRILRIRSATNVTDNNRPLKIINVQDIENLTAEDYGVLRPINQIDTVGLVRYMVIGEEEGYVRWINVPSYDVTVQLVTERLPVTEITGPGHAMACVRSEHHFHLMKWMRHLAYRKQDADTFNLVKSDQERNDFVEYCEFAKREKGTRKHKVRTTGYGGI